MKIDLEFQCQCVMMKDFFQKKESVQKHLQFVEKKGQIRLKIARKQLKQKKILHKEAERAHIC